MSGLRRRSTRLGLFDEGQATIDSSSSSSHAKTVTPSNAQPTRPRPLDRKPSYPTGKTSSTIWSLLYRLGAAVRMRRLSLRRLTRLLVWAILTTVMVVAAYAVLSKRAARSLSSQYRSTSIAQTGVPTQWLKSLSHAALKRHARVISRMKKLSPSEFDLDFCPGYGHDDQLSQKYGRSALIRTRAHSGSSKRIHKLIAKALSGEPITISVLGGSVSACRGDPMNPECYPHRVFSWLMHNFPNQYHELTNGAGKRMTVLLGNRLNLDEAEMQTDTSYFACCAQWHLPELTDLVILEFNNEDTENLAAAKSTEILLRTILQRPEAPAVLVLSTFAPRVQQDYGYLDAEVAHNAVARFYDVPHLSVKGLLYEDFLHNSSRVMDTHFVDPVLMNESGHTALADIIISYLQSEICSFMESVSLTQEPITADASSSAKAARPIAVADEEVEGPPARFRGQIFHLDQDLAAGSGYDKIKRSENLWRRTGIPPFLMNDKPHELARFRDVKPYCITANNHLTPLPRKAFRGSGWLQKEGSRGNKKGSWYSTKPGSRLRIPVEVSAGDIFVQYLRPPLGEGHGRARCWVDDNERNAVELVAGPPDAEPEIRVVQIDLNVGKGSHFVMCELFGEDATVKQPMNIYGVFCT